MDVEQIAEGLWRWTARHPEWRPDADWPPDVGCVYYEGPDAVVLVDPLVPQDDADRFWAALDRDVERAARDLLGGDEGAIAFTDSTTAGLGLLYSGLRLRPGDEILTTEHDFYATHEALRLLAAAGPGASIGPFSAN